jgi:hypothetical protein
LFGLLQLLAQGGHLVAGSCLGSRMAVALRRGPRRSLGGSLGGGKQRGQLLLHRRLDACANHLHRLGSRQLSGH